PGRGRLRAGRDERGDAGDRAHRRRTVPLEDRAGAAGEDRQSREEDAEELHQPRRLRHHRGGTALPGAADPRRGATALRQGRPAALRAAEEHGGGGQAAPVHAMSAGGSARAPGKAASSSSTSASTAASASRSDAARRSPPNSSYSTATVRTSRMPM